MGYGQVGWPSADQVWCSTLAQVLNHGHESSPRDMLTKEKLAYTSQWVDIRKPIITCKERKLGYKFQAAEAWWILSGKNDVKSISPYSKAISKFSDDGIYFAGAYGPPLVDQLSYVVNALYNDTDTRQAVATIWRQNPRASKDIPCTLSVQLLIRSGLLYAVVSMRSSDLWLGWPYDIFNFACYATYVLLLLRTQDESFNRIHQGGICINAGSQHLYERNFSGAQQCVLAYETHINQYAPSPDRLSSFTDYKNMDVDDFESPEHFLEILGDVKDLGGMLKWLS